MAITDAVIPVGGLGTRLLPATRSQPKEMLPLVDTPVVQKVVEELVRAGISRVLFITGRRKRAIEDHFDAQPELGAGPLLDPRTGLQIFYTRQAEPAGLGDALRYGAGFSAGGVAVALGDALITTPAGARPGIVPRLIEAYEDTGADAALAVTEVGDEEVSRYGIAVIREDGDPPGEVVDVVEKPAADEVASRTGVMGRYVLGPAVFDALRRIMPSRPGGEVDLADALRLVIGQGGRVVAIPLGPGERRHDIGTVEGYCTAFVAHALADPRVGPAVRALLDGGS